MDAKCFSVSFEKYVQAMTLNKRRNFLSDLLESMLEYELVTLQEKKASELDQHKMKSVVSAHAVLVIYAEDPMINMQEALTFISTFKTDKQ